MRTLLRILTWLAATTVILFALELALKSAQGYRFMGGDIITDYGIHIISLVGISISLAVSLNLINGYTGQFSLGHAGFMAIGGYTSAYITYTVLGSQAQRDPVYEVLVFIGALIAGALTSAIAGLIVGIPSLRLKGDYLAIVTLGFGEIIRLNIENIDAVGGQRGFFGIPRFPSLIWIYLFAVITIIIVHNIVNSSYGRSLIAIRENEIAAEAMGINTARYKVIAFTISAALAGVAGGLFAHQEGQLVAKTFDFVRSVEIIVMIVFGGMGSITGSVLGAIVLTVLPEFLRELKELRMIIYSLLLVIIMIVRPQGILGHRELSLQWLRSKLARSHTGTQGVKIRAASAEEGEKS
ncbi:MAG: branched-chain amino acid ABC transporter permease [Acidobacteriota bacterium]